MLCRIRYCFGYWECRAYNLFIQSFDSELLQVWARCSKTVRSLSASQWATTLLIGARLSAIILHSLELKLAIDDQRHPFYASDLWTNVLHLASDNESWMNNWFLLESKTPSDAAKARRHWAAHLFDVCACMCCTFVVEGWRMLDMWRPLQYMW